MKSKWLKKAMAAFLAVLMTVCALPVAAFVPETVETGEEFDGAENALPYYYVSDGNLYVQIENETQQIYPEYSFEYIYSGYEYVFAHGKNENGEIYDIVLGFMDCVDFDSKAENANLYTVTGSANETAIYNYAVNTMGLNTAAACGILANIQKESGFNPHALGDSGTSYGICQWHNSRWDRLKDYCTSNHLDSTTIEGQLRYLEYELKNFYSSVWNRLKSVKNTAEGAYDAAAYWCAVFEVPAGYGYWSNGEIHYGETSIARGNLAKSTYWNEYSSAGDSGTNASLTATNAQQQVVDYALSKVGTSFANGYCQAFVSYTYANAGVGCGQVFYCCATKAWQTCGKGYSISDIPLGATVYFSDENAGSSRVYDDVCKQYCGHVGIYVGNGYVVHGWGGKVVKTTLNYITQCGYPYRGWGWHANFALADIKDVNFDTITTNTYRLVNNGSYLTTTADNNTTVLTAKAKSGTSNQQFYISPNSRFSQSYIIKSQAYSSGRVVNVFTTGVSANGDNVTLYTSTTDASQSWRFEAKSGGYLIHPVDNTGLALTNSNGTVKVMTSSGASNQIWTLASAVDTYTVSYNANGGTGAPGNQTKTHGQSLTLSSVKPTKDGYTFQGWSTTLNGSVQYNPGSAYSGNANLTLYAVWSIKTYTISYNANGGTGAPASQTKVHGQNLTLSNMRPTKDGYTFQGWSTILYGTVAYQPGGQFDENRNLTLHAVWSQKTYTVSYDANGGTGAPASQTKVHGDALTLSTVKPTRSGYEFKGWATSSNGNVEYSAGAAYAENANVTLYAVWEHSAGNLTWKIKDGTLYISGTGAMENYTDDSPAPWKGSSFTKAVIEYGATNIGENAFAEAYYLKTITIPESVTSIGENAFYKCSSLTSMTIPSSVKSIGCKAFYNCSSLTSMTIPSSVTSIGDEAFYNCSSLTSMTIPSSVKSIGDYAFYNCSSLTAIAIPNGVEHIGIGAFKKCSSLTSVTIPRSVTSIPALPFSDCSNLTFIAVDEDNSNYSNDEQGVLFNKNKTELLQYPMGNTSTSYDIPLSVTRIHVEAFSSCSNLKNVIIPKGVTNIETCTFFNCKGLTQVTIPSSVTSIGECAFQDCSSLALVNLPDSLTSISGTTFTGCSSLKSIIIPPNVTKIPEDIFYGCSNLTSVTIPNSVTTIGEYAFFECKKLSDVFFQGSQTEWNNIEIGKYNSDLTNATLHLVIPVTSITLNQTTASLQKGETLTLTATVAPSDAANKSVTWSSGNTSVATVSTSGVVTAVGEGTAVITVKTADGGKTATCTVAVAHTHNYTGTYYETAHPHKAYSKCSCGEINYTGATQKVASCASCYPVTGVTLDKTTATLKKGETLTLSVTVSPSDAANKAFTVTSSNPSVMSAKYRIGICVGDLFDGSTCTVSHCEFTALSAGSTTLTFTTEDGQKTASCKVTVTEPVVNAKAKFTLSEASGRPGDTVKITLSLKTEETVNSIAISGITYDKSIMTFTGFSDYEHIEDLTILPPTFDEEKMAIVIGLKTAAAFDGDICTLNFKINENALEGVTNIDASSVVKLKSAEIPSAVASGKVNVRLQTLGDIDGNDTVDIDDAVLLFQYSMLPELYPISYAGNLDFNKDGTVDIDDAVRLFQYSMLPDLYPLE